MALLAGFTGTTLMAAPAAATWSVVAVDPETGEVGAAIASCISAEVLGDPAAPLIPVVVVPGAGVGVSQGQLDVEAPGLIAELVGNGVDADEVVAALIDPERDPLLALRQHGVVVLQNGAGDGGAQAGAHTGDDNGEIAAQRLGATVSVQGNLLASEAVIDDTFDAFEAADGAGDPLAAALVEALSAGAAAGGDRRCDGQTALFAQVAVAGPDDDPTRPGVLLTVLVTEGDGRNPVNELSLAWSQGRRGLIDLTTEPTGSRGLFRVAVFFVAMMLVAVAAFAFARGIGSISARR